MGDRYVHLFADDVNGALPAYTLAALVRNPRNRSSESLTLSRSLAFLLAPLTIYSVIPSEPQRHHFGGILGNTNISRGFRFTGALKFATVSGVFLIIYLFRFEV